MKYCSHFALTWEKLHFLSQIVTDFGFADSGNKGNFFCLLFILFLWHRVSVSVCLEHPASMLPACTPLHASCCCPCTVVSVGTVCLQILRGDFVQNFKVFIYNSPSFSYIILQIIPNSGGIGPSVLKHSPENLLSVSRWH